jgi:uncharacterized protein (DUF1778 family)
MIPKRPQINFRLAPDQYEKLQKSAAPFGLSVSAYAKALAVKSNDCVNRSSIMKTP